MSDKFIQITTASDCAGGVRLFALDESGQVWEYNPTLYGSWQKLDMSGYSDASASRSVSSEG